MNHLKTIICALVLGTLTCSPLAWAGSYDIKEMTPEIQQALSGRQARYGQLKQLKSSGAIGENNEGYVEALSGPGKGLGAASSGRQAHQPPSSRADRASTNAAPQGQRRAGRTGDNGAATTTGPRGLRLRGPSRRSVGSARRLKI